MDHTGHDSGNRWRLQHRTRAATDDTDYRYQPVAAAQDACRANICALPQSTLALFGKPTPTIGWVPATCCKSSCGITRNSRPLLGQPAQNGKTTDAASGFLIDEQGDVQFPYAGTVHVAGKDVGTIQKELYSRLSKVYQKPEVTVRVASFRARRSM